jgi:hypothetical protein
MSELEERGQLGKSEVIDASDQSSGLTSAKTSEVLSGLWHNICDWNLMKQRDEI